MLGAYLSLFAALPVDVTDAIILGSTITVLACMPPLDDLGYSNFFADWMPPLAWCATFPPAAPWSLGFVACEFYLESRCCFCSKVALLILSFGLIAVIALDVVLLGRQLR